jgi:uncharacterized circularly permuted ATP-grasp superfamily protein/uncharacterized alpha-E superfamily protein
MSEPQRAKRRAVAGALASYAQDPRRYDELLDEHGQVRAHWRGLIDVFAGDSQALSRRRVELTQRLIIENGVTYNVYADPKGTDRPWTLDTIPLVIDAQEWREVEQGVLQRAQLLDRVLADLYGEQCLLKEGIAPSALAYGHPNFLWPCHGVVPRDGCWLHLYAVDLARAPNGRWWVLADRTQAPSGYGYALENREIGEQVIADGLRNLSVRRIRSFVERFREQLLQFAGDDGRPLAVILTPGPFNETYFEHAYLARQLGLVLAEGHDLTVRRDEVFLKTLGGLRRVHTIYRRLDDDYCDPLELRSDSALGVPGLLGAVRAQRVVIANALGSGVLESAAWLGFIPGIAQRLGGETLRLPSVATWWCGESPALDYVLEHLDEVVIKPTFPNQRFEPVFGSEVTGEQRDRLVARLRARPYAYVAQERIALSQAPAQRSEGGIAARPFTLRVYVAQTSQGRVVMPGGMARIAQDGAIDIVSTQRGGGSKDVWVLNDEEHTDTPAPATSAAPITLGGEEAPSRLVENLYWFGRYSVRCEEHARLLRATLGVRADARAWRAATDVCSALGMSVTDSNVLNDEDPAGLLADVRRLAWCASQVRSRISPSFWRASLDLQLQLGEAVTRREEPREALERLLLSLAALSGYAFDHMTRDEPWYLMRMGRRLERLQFLCSLLEGHLLGDAPTQPRQIEWLLEVCDSHRAYRSHYASAPRLSAALDLLLRDADHPRSVAFQEQAIARDLASLAVALGDRGVQAEQRPHVLSDADLLLLEKRGGPGVERRALLAEHLRTLRADAAILSDRVSMRYFSHVDFDTRTLTL